MVLADGKPRRVAELAALVEDKIPPEKAAGYYSRRANGQEPTLDQRIRVGSRRLVNFLMYSMAEHRPELRIRRLRLPGHRVLWYIGDESR